MNKDAISRIFVSGMFLASVTIGADLLAEASAQPPISGPAQQAPSKGATATKEAVNAAEAIPACQKIVAECKKLGFIDGEYNQDNGLWGDCYDPVISGKNSTRKGKTINVPVSANDLEACRAQTNPACQGILAECQKLGFISGGWKQDNGLWGDCFDPVISGKNSTRKGKAINVPVSSNDLGTCRGAVAPQKH